MHVLYTFLIALANNIDNIGVRIAYSIRGIKINPLQNLWISVITFLISCLSALAGWGVSGACGGRVSSVVSMVLLAGLGAWMIIEQYIHREKPRGGKIQGESQQEEERQDPRENNLLHILQKPEMADMDRSKNIDFKEATLLGIALSLNNVGGGLSAGMIGLNSFLVGFMSAVISYLALWAGNYITQFLQRFNLGKKTAVLAGIALILIGIKQVI